MSAALVIPHWVQGLWLAAALLFLFGLKQMASPLTARRGMVAAGYGMVVATVAALALPGLGNIGLIVCALLVGAGLAYFSGRRVKMTDMPQMVAIYNGMGGGAAAAIAAVELVHGGVGRAALSLALIGALIGATSFTGSLIAFAKLQGWLQKPIRLPGQNQLNVLLAVAAVLLAFALIAGLASGPLALLAFFALALLLGVVVTLPIGGADMPVVISLFNAFTGLAVGFEGYVLQSPLLMIAGIVVGAAGTLLTQLMAKAMNRPLTNILFTPLTASSTQAAGIAGTLKELTPLDAAALMRYAAKVIIVPGYGMAVAHAQHKVWELATLLQQAGVEVRFAIHPVAGRMPGHMNVLLAEAGVPYDLINDLDDINSEFAQADVALVIGANDVVNPAARTDKGSPIYGMPILNADAAEHVIVMKRGKGVGYAGIDNSLFYLDRCRMLYGDAQPTAAAMVQQLKTLL